jgi:cytochrome c-type biogenesis protein CcmH
VNIFWVIVAALVTTAVAALLWALLRRRPNANTVSQNLILRDMRIAELRRDVADQVIDEQDLSAAEDEIARALLEESDPDTLEKAAPNNTARWLIVAIIVCGIPSIAVFTYLSLGTPELAMGAAPITESAGQEIDQQTIDDLIALLEKRLVDDPESAEGWLLLGRTQLSLGRYDKAVTTLARAHELVGDVPQVLLQYADALAMADGGRINNEVRELVTRALVLEPENVAALWLAGLGAAEAGEREQALEYIRHAKTISVRDGAPSVEIDAVIRELESVADTEHQPETTIVAASVAVKVNVDPTLKSRIKSDDMLFVFARSPNQGGPPLAVRRMQTDSFPREVVLDDTMSMAPMFKMKAGDTVVVTARVSKSGEPSAQSGDLQGTSEPFVIGELTTVNLVIEDVVK